MYVPSKSRSLTIILNTSQKIIKSTLPPVPHLGEMYYDLEL